MCLILPENATKEKYSKKRRKYNTRIPNRLGMNLVPGSVFFWVVWEVRGSVLEDKPRFGIFGFVPISNGKFTYFFIFYVVRTFGSVQGSFFFGRFGCSKFSFRGQTFGLEGSRFGFLKVREVRGSVFSGSFQV